MSDTNKFEVAVFGILGEAWVERHRGGGSAKRNRSDVFFTGAPKPRLVRWLDGGAPIAHRYAGSVLSIDAGAIGSSGNVRVIEVEVAPR